MDWLDRRLSRRRYLVGSAISEADWRLFTTLVRFDAVYHYHFKCNRQRIADYPELGAYLRDLYQQPGIAETVFMDHIKTHYYYSHDTINPPRIARPRKLRTRSSAAASSPSAPGWTWTRRTTAIDWVSRRPTT